MVIKIESYRGVDINFNTDNETFYYVITKDTKEKASKSYSVVKKFIDDYLKYNNAFEPFIIISVPNSYRINKIKKGKRRYCLAMMKNIICSI